MQYKELLLIKNINMQKEFPAELIVIIKGTNKKLF